MRESVKRGRPRQVNPHIPAHIDQAQIPTGVYFDHRHGGSWYTRRQEGSVRRRIELAGPRATLADLHRRMEEIRADDTTGTIDWLCGLFEDSDTFAGLSAATRADYTYCRGVLHQETDRKGLPLARWPVASFTAPVIQLLIDRIGKAHPSKANHLLRYLRRLFRWGANRGHAPRDNPAAKIEPARERKQRALPEPATMAAVLRYAQRAGALAPRQKGAQPAYLWAAAELAYLCRLRGIEVVTLTDANALEAGILTNRRKGSRDNIVAWTPRLRSAWDALADRRDAIWAVRRLPVPMKPEDRVLVVAEDGGPLRREALTQAWGRLMRAAIADGVLTAEQRFSMHAFKRRGITDTAGTRADKQQASGHKAAAMLDVYDFDVPVVKPAGE